MNRTTFQIYGTKKTGIFQSTWDTTIVSLGNERTNVLATGTNWALNTGAINLSTGGYKHTTGSTASLVTGIGFRIMQIYQIQYTISERTAGSVSINYGGNTISGITASSVEIKITTVDSALLVIPTSDFDGVVVISLKEKSSEDNQIKLPLPNIGTYSILVDWGDGNTDNITTWNSPNTLHTYANPGTYSVRISGDPFNWQFPFSTNTNFVFASDNLKMKKISSWGKLKLGLQSFTGCSNLILDAVTDIPDLSGVTSLSTAFTGCSKITTIRRVNEWNTSTINNFNNIFGACTLFNQDLGNWIVDNATNLQDMFSFATSFNNGGTSSLNNWNVSNVTSFTNMFFGSTSFNNGFVPGVENQLTWNINTITPSVIMNNMFYGATSFNSNLGTGSTPWDVSKVTSFSNMFRGCSVFTNGNNSAAINDWSINIQSGVNVDMTSMFELCSVFNRPIENWNMSNVVTIRNMFKSAIVFDQPLAGWERSTPGDVSTLNKVNNFRETFQNALVFNQDIGNWNTSAATNMGAMFQNARLFNQSIGGWDVSKVITIDGMFYTINGIFNNGNNEEPLNNWTLNTSASASVFMGYMFYGQTLFNRNLNSWNTSRVTSVGELFVNCTSFNNGFASGVPNQLTWDTSACTSTFRMFLNCVSFNSNLGTGSTPWDVSKVENMQQMFSGCSVFNNGDNSADINNWNVSEVTTMNSMFAGCLVFDRALAGWERTTPGDTSSLSEVINMNSMFVNARVFNQPIGNWNTSAVTNMAAMFSEAGLFNQSIGGWDVSKVITFEAMFFYNLNNGTFNNGDDSAPLNNWILNTDPTASVSMYVMFRGIPFNRNLNSWNTSRVTNMIGTFQNCTSFNNGTASGVANQLTWNTSACTSMNAIFDNCTSFNSNLGTGTTPWDVSKVIDMRLMFRLCSVFNNGNNSADINNWNVSEVTAMFNMFNQAFLFNRNIGSWDVSSVSNFSNMFQNATSFNNGGTSSINTWQLKTTGSITMDYMFNANGVNLNFNQPIGSWNVSRVTNMEGMFSNTFGSVTTTFNQPLATWERSTPDVSTLANVINMRRMFFTINSSNSPFQQNIGNWNISNVTNFLEFMTGKTTTTFPSTNLDNIYNGWSSLPSVKPNTISPLTNISFGGARYTTASVAGRAILTGPPNNWVITDGGVL